MHAFNVILIQFDAVFDCFWFFILLVVEAGQRANSAPHLLYESIPLKYVLYMGQCKQMHDRELSSISLYYIS